VLADGVRLHAVHVRTGEVDERAELDGRVAAVVPGRLDAPRAIADRDRLASAARADGVDHELGPRADLGAARFAAVERHLVGDQPAGDRGVVGEPRGERLDVPGLPAHEPDVRVQIAAGPPGRVPVLSRHVTDDERRDGRHPGLTVGFEKVGEALAQDVVHRGRCRHEVRPVEERSGHRQPVVAQHGELGAHDGGVVAAPHQRAAGARPEVGAEPADRRAGTVDLGEVAVNLRSSGSPATSRRRRSGRRPDTSAAAGSR
jgi:hypothetical protein